MSTATEADTVTVPDDLADIEAHYVCGICYPETMNNDGITPNVRGICGTEIAGVPAADDAPNCEACVDCSTSHAMEHWMDGWRP